MYIGEFIVHMFIMAVEFAAGQEYSESCADSYYQDYGLIHLAATSTVERSPVVNCRWNFTVKHGETISIIFHHFIMEEAPNCSLGYVEILDGLSYSSKSILSKTCSQLQTPVHFQSTSTSVSIHMYSSSSTYHPSLLASARSVSTATTYEFHPQQKTWLGAREFCQQNNGELASVYPFPSEELSHLVENNKEGADAWVGQFVTPWASLQGCVRQSLEHGMQLRYLHSKYNQMFECSVACAGAAGFLLQGGSCYCVTEHHNAHLDYTLPAKRCNIPCPGNMVERCGGTSAFTYYETYDIDIEKGKKYRDCLSETLMALDAEYCSDKLGFTCGFKNGSSATYYGDNALSWQDAVSFCNSILGSIGIRDLPIWPDHTVWALWTSKTRSQHPNYPQIFNRSAGPETAYIASTDKNKQYELKLRNASSEYPFICEYRSCNCGGNLTSSSGIIQSPGFPNSYGYNMFCEWEITVTNDYHVRLEFTNFLLEEHELCHYDFVKIIGTTDEQETRFCGNLIPRLHLSEGNNLTLIFKSDNSLSGTGFQASWLTVPLNDAENASTTELDGAAIAGIVLGTVLVILLLALTIFLCKKRQKTTTQPLTVTNQIYGLSSLNDEPITEGHSYMNVTDRVIDAYRQPDVIEQCYSTPVRGDLQVNTDVPDERDGYEYETIAENRLESDALEFCHNSGSQANLIASDGEDSIDTDLCDVKETQYEQDTISKIDLDDITLTSNLTLDDTDK